jgi:hypothetical protein
LPITAFYRLRILTEIARIFSGARPPITQIEGGFSHEP